MMKEICAQCLQLHRDPVTGKETVVFSCFNQDQALDRVDFACLRQRLRRTACRRSSTRCGSTARCASSARDDGLPARASLCKLPVIARR